MQSRNAFAYWFTFNPRKVAAHADLGSYDVWDQEGNLVEVSDLQRPEVELDFTKFKETRPEAVIGEKIDISINVEYLRDRYNLLITGAMLMRMPDKEDQALRLAQRCTDVLSEADFYCVPGSTRYHDSVPHGLLHHSLRVYNHMMSLLTLDIFAKVNIAEAVLVALSHDWCKIGMYKLGSRNAKNPDTGEWEQVLKYDKVTELINPFFHGQASAFFARRCFPLTMEMELAITHHMGLWNTPEREVDVLQYANRKYPMVHLLQFADQLAITDYD